jgi:transposase
LTCRIKYNILKSGELQSDDIQSSSGASYYAKIDFVKGHWRIFNAKRRNVIKEGFSKNKNVLRRMVRRELQNLGVKLEKEFKESGYAKTKKRRIL